MLASRHTTMEESSEENYDDDMDDVAESLQLQMGFSFPFLRAKD